MAGWLLAAAVVTGCRDGGRGDDGGKDAASPAEDPGAKVSAIGTLPPGTDKETAEQGRELYASVCVVCHGEDGGGNQLGPSLKGPNWVHAPGGGFEQIVQVVTAGVPAPQQFPVPMPARGTGYFTDDQIRAVSAYTYSLARPAAGAP